MLQIKLTLTVASAGMIYYGSEYLYSFFSTPATPMSAHGGVAVAAPTVLPGAAALIGGVILAFVCIFLWTSSIGQQRRRYTAMPVRVEPAYTPPSPTYTLADMPMPATPGSRRPMPRMAGSGPGAGPRRQHQVASGQAKTNEDASSLASAKVPPPFDPYTDESGS
jgi:hypothetical protein